MSQVKTVTTSQLDVAYYNQGEGDRAVILLHGFPDEASGWDSVAEGLVAAGYHTYAPYLRGFGPTRFLSDDLPRSGQLAALVTDTVEFADALGLERFTLVGHDWGARAAQGVAALYPKRVERLISFTDYEVAWDESGFPPFEVLHALWYQWVLLSEIGPPLLYANKKGFCRYLWRVWSPTWDFSEEEFEEAAAAFYNPDFAQVVLSSYRYGRVEDAVDDPSLEALEHQLTVGPPITVPTTLLIGADDGIVQPFSEDKSWKQHFTGKASRRLLRGVGHFPHREAPEEVVKAVLEQEEVTA